MRVYVLIWVSILYGLSSSNVFLTLTWRHHCSVASDPFSFPEPLNDVIDDAFLVNCYTMLLNNGPQGSISDHPS